MFISLVWKLFEQILYCKEVLRLLAVCIFGGIHSRYAHIFQKSKSHLKILGARRVTWSKFHTEDPQILGATILTYLLTPWSRVLLEKLPGFAANQEIPRILWNLKFITILTSTHHLSLSWAKPIQSPQPLPTSWRSILILSSHLRLGLPNGLLIKRDH